MCPVLLEKQSQQLMLVSCAFNSSYQLDCYIITRLVLERDLQMLWSIQERVQLKFTGQLQSTRNGGTKKHKN